MIKLAADGWLRMLIKVIKINTMAMVEPDKIVVGVEEVNLQH